MKYFYAGICKNRFRTFNFHGIYNAKTMRPTELPKTIEEIMADIIDQRDDSASNVRLTAFNRID